MNISELIKENQDKAAMLNRALETQVKLYAEKTHFIYELLQNAEDAGATNVCFLQFAEHLEVLHDGKPFTLSNAQSLCDAANSDKKDESGKIGKFGVGFKSVFAICSTVDLYSEPSNRPTEDALPKFAIRIEHYTDPININEDWSMEYPYTTRFIFPYDCGTYYKSIDELKSDVSRKLLGLGTSVLLFMKNIKEIHYLINGVGSSYDGKGSYMLDRQDLGDNICKVTALGETNNNADDNSYLVFSKYIEQTERTVDIAYSIIEENRKIKFIKSASPFVFVYFPTETESKLNFIVQAPFDLTPNRSSLEHNSERNAEMVKMLAVLFMESVIEIRERAWLSLDFLNLLPYDSDNPAFNPLWHFYLLHKKAYDIIKNEAIIPTYDGSYIEIKDAKIQRSAKLLDLFEGELLCKLLNNSKAKWLPKDFTENSPLKAFHGFLKELGAEEIGSNELPKLLRANPAFLKSVDDDWLASFYGYLASDVKNLLGKNGDLATVPFVKTADGNFNAPFVSRRVGRTTETEQSIYMRPKNANYPVEGFLFVDEFIEQNCAEFLKVLGLTEPDGFDYFVKELEIGRGKKEVDNEVNLAQVKKAIQYLKTGQEKAKETFSDLLWLKVTDTKGESWYTLSHGSIYREKDYNGVSLKDYFSSVDCDVYTLDEQFYLDGGMTAGDIKLLEQLGIRNSIYEHIDTEKWYSGNAQCFCLGDFRELLEFTHIHKVLNALRMCHDNNEFKLTIWKSAAIFALLQNVEKHLKGQWQYRSTNPEIRDGTARIVSSLNGDSHSKWLVTEFGDLVNPSEISRFDLNEAIYGKINSKSDIYEILGFKKTNDDMQEALVREFISRYTKEQIDSIIKSVIPEETKDVFDPDVDEVYTDFPEEPIKDLQRLRNAVKSWYLRAPDVVYERVLRSIRKSRGQDKEHIKHRYKGYCQICEDPNPYWEIAEIFNNPQKEFSQMNLSLCPGCASQYRIMRNDSVLMQKFRDNIINADLTANPCMVALGKEPVHFTKAHLAEIQEILKLEKQ